MLHCPYFVRYGDLRASVVLPAANMTVVKHVALHANNIRAITGAVDQKNIVILIFTVDKSDHDLQGHLSKS